VSKPTDFGLWYDRDAYSNRAALLAFGEIGYEGGLGEVASAAVIG